MAESSPGLLQVCRLSRLQADWHCTLHAECPSSASGTVKRRLTSIGGILWGTLLWSQYTYAMAYHLRTVGLVLVQPVVDTTT